MRQLNQLPARLISTRLLSTRQEVSVLERVVTEHIAKDLGIRPDEVTPQFIHEWREKNLYPQAPVNITNRIGGFHAVGKRILNGDEVESLHKFSETFLGQFL